MIWLTRLFSWTSPAQSEAPASPGYIFTASGQSRAHVAIDASFDFTAAPRSFEMVATQ